MKLSIAMPSRNQGRFIGKALDSIVSQAHGDVEVIVRDCLSSDDTPQVLANYQSYPFVHIVSEHDLGQSDALAKSFAQASGDVFCWLNSDDVLLPGAIRAVLDTFASQTEADVVYGEAVFLDQNDAIVSNFPTARPNLWRLRDRCVLSQPSVFFRRDAYFGVGGLNSSRNFCMDYELWTRFALARKRFVYIPQALSGTRLHSETKTANGGRAFVEEICDMQLSLLGNVSPVWRLYERSRSPDLEHIQRKPLRFALAALCELALHPWSLPRLAIALMERTSAEVLARLRGVHPQST